jgi:hypothetical protein
MDDRSNRIFKNAILAESLMNKPKRRFPTLTFSVSPEERHQIRGDAATAGLSVASYIRKHLLKQSKVAPTFRPTETRFLIRELISRLGRVGITMNRIHFHSAGDRILRSHAVNPALRAVDRTRLHEGAKALSDMRLMLIAYLLKRPRC